MQRYNSRVTTKWRLPQRRVINETTSDACRLVSVQHVRAAVHQLHERASAAVLQPPHVRSGAGDLQEGRHQLGVHRLRNGSCRLYRAHREGTPFVAKALTGGCSVVELFLNHFYLVSVLLVRNNEKCQRGNNNCQ